MVNPRPSADEGKSTRTIFKPVVPFPLEPIGTVAGGDDYVRGTVQDNLGSGVTSLECAVFGFEEEP